LQNVVMYDCVIGVSNPDLKLKPGMTANVSIIVAYHENILKVPNVALRVSVPETSQEEMKGSGSPGEPASSGHGKGKGKRKPHTVYFFPASGTKDKPRPVQIRKGISDGTETEIIEGLAEGDHVIVAVSGAQDRSSSTKSPFGGGVRKY